MRTKVFIAVGAAVGAAGLLLAQRSAEPRPLALCHWAVSASAGELERMNVADGLKPDAPFSIDDYCGAGCLPAGNADAGAFDRCVDSCSACLGATSGEGEE